MKTVKQNIVYLFLALSFLLSGQAAHAFGWSSEADCQYIEDADSKHLCRALTIEQPTVRGWYTDDCERIKDADTKNLCYGLTREQPKKLWSNTKNDCDKIKDHSMKTMCHLMGNQKKSKF